MRLGGVSRSMGTRLGGQQWSGYETRDQQWSVYENTGTAVAALTTVLCSEPECHKRFQRVR